MFKINMHEERWTGEEMKAKIQETIMAYNEGFAGQVAKVWGAPL